MTLVILALLVSCFCGPLGAQETPRSVPPNVLFIAVDDLRPELGCYGTRAHTPNIDRLAASGLQFDRAYCNQAVCGASRVSLMTGLYPEFTGERTFHVTDWRTRWAKIVTLNQSSMLERGPHSSMSGFRYHHAPSSYHHSQPFSSTL